MGVQSPDLSRLRLSLLEQTADAHSTNPVSANEYNGFFFPAWQKKSSGNHQKMHAWRIRLFTLAPRRLDSAPDVEFELPEPAATTSRRDHSRSGFDSGRGRDGQDAGNHLPD